MSYTLDFSLNLGTAYGGKTDMRAQLVDTAGTNVGSAISTGFTEIGTSSGFYLWHCTTIPDSHRGGVKFYSNAASTVILTFASINPQEAENADAKSSAVTLSSAGVAAIWAYSSRTLTSFGTLIADIWSYITRTLTTPAASGTDPVDGTDLNITIAATLGATITGLTISASWTKIYFTIKADKTDADADAIVQIVVSNPGAGGDGLIRLANGTVTAGNGALTVTQASGTVAVLIADDATVSLEENVPYYYDLKQLTSDGKSVILTSGVCSALLPVTLSIS